MQVKIVSDRAQDFNGERYYLCGRYFQRRGKRLHRAVYEFHNGEIKKGFHVHHIDGDRSNNQIENLSLVAGRVHAAAHAKDKDCGQWQEAMRKGAARWHGSAEGRAWHAEQYEKHCKAALSKKVEVTCEFCGASFQGAAGKARFCSNKCRAASRRASGVDEVTKQCPVCGGSFTRNKYTISETCSASCGRTLYVRRSREHNSVEK